MRFVAVSKFLDDDGEVLAECNFDIDLPDHAGDDEAKHMVLGEGVNTYGEIAKQSAFNAAWKAAKALVVKIQAEQENAIEDLAPLLKKDEPTVNKGN